MTDEQWEETVDRAEKQFGVGERGEEALAEGGYVAWIEFEGPQGRMKLERTVKPRLKEARMTFSKRIGSGVVVKKVYDPEAMVSFMKAYRWNEGSDDWEEMRGAW